MSAVVHTAPTSTPLRSTRLVVVTDEGHFGFCDTCAAETLFEQPGCVDGHGLLCPEWVCVDCGIAVDVPVGEHDEPVVAVDTVVLTGHGGRRGIAA